MSHWCYEGSTAACVTLKALLRAAHASIAAGRTRELLLQLCGTASKVLPGLTGCSVHYSCFCDKDRLKSLGHCSGRHLAPARLWCFVQGSNAQMDGAA